MARKKPKPDPALPDNPFPAAVEAVVVDSAPTDIPNTDTPPGPPAAEPTGSEATPGTVQPTGPKPFAIKSDFPTGVTLREDKRYRQVQLQFVDKPSDAVRMIVREAGFSWQPTDRVWVKPIDREAGWKSRLDAERLFQEVVEQIAHEQGNPQSR